MSTNITPPFGSNAEIYHSQSISLRLIPGFSPHMIPISICPGHCLSQFNLSWEFRNSLSRSDLFLFLG